MATNKNNVCISGTAMTISVAGTDLGFTKGGVSMEVTEETYKVIMDQSLTAILESMTSRECVVRTVLGESTLANLKTAWNLADSALVSSSLSLDTSTKGEVVLVFTGKGPNATTRTATFFSAVAVSAGENTYAKDQETLIPVEFRCLWNSTQSKFGTIVDA